MCNLDDINAYTSIDRSGMGIHIRNLPLQCRQAWTKGMAFPLPADYRGVNKVLILGMGGSAIGGDLMQGLSDKSSVPIIIHRDYELPCFVDDNTLVIASSYSGNTEETLSGFTQSLKSKCKKLVISSGGRISALAREHGVPIFAIEHISAPRAALGYSLLPLLAIMLNIGLINLNSTEVETSIKAMEKLCAGWQEDNPLQNNQAKILASKLNGKLIVIYGAGILSAVARRWKTQVNENSKAYAFFETFPELNHNAVTGYHLPENIKENIFVAMLRCPSLHPRILARYIITGEILDKMKVPHQIIDSEGTNSLQHVLNMVYLGDWVSYYLSILNNMDPSPVPEIDYLKNRLAQIK